MTQSESIRFECEPYEKQLLRTISERTGRAGMSATIRRLIHDEARRLDIFIREDAKVPAGN